MHVFALIYLKLLTKQFHGAESFLRSRQLRSYSRISQYFMKPDGCPAHLMLLDFIILIILGKVYKL
jgi:hypothetical protein